MQTPSLPPAVIADLGFAKTIGLTLGMLALLRAATAVWTIFRLRRATTKFRGPPNQAFFWGRGKEIIISSQPIDLYSGWAREYGPVFAVPSVLGSTRVFVHDPRAIGHIYTNHNDFTMTKLSTSFIRTVFGAGLLGAEGADHTRQRKQLSPAFSNASIRKMTPVFFDSAYKLVTAWDSVLESSPSGQSAIEVQLWMNRISLDSIGIAGFDTDFEALLGKTSSITEVFEAFGEGRQHFVDVGLILLSAIFPVFLKVPTERMRLLHKLTETTEEIATVLLARSKKETLEGGSLREEKSLIGLLIKSENAGGTSGMSQQEIMAQINVLFLAGYETTSIGLTWALIELSRNPECQARLRDELMAFGADPTWDELNGAETLPYLDALVHETLRLHPPVSETDRMSARDQFIPLSRPLTTADGTTVDQIFVAKGQTVTVPIGSVNRLPQFWGADSDEFVPERWLKENPAVAGLPAGHRHLFTFIDGPRICLGKAFALAEFKAVLSVLARNYQFELPAGKSTPLGAHRSILLRPKILGEDGPSVTLNVKKVVQ